jgi:hypothetical protein
MARNIESRLRRIEEQLNLSKKIPKLTLIIMDYYRYGDKSIAESLGPIEQWITYKRAVAAYEKGNLIIFTPDPQLEIEARKRPLTQDELDELSIQL